MLRQFRYNKWGKNCKLCLEFNHKSNATLFICKFNIFCWASSFTNDAADGDPLNCNSYRRHSEWIYWRCSFSKHQHFCTKYSALEIHSIVYRQVLPWKISSKCWTLKVWIRVRNNFLFDCFDRNVVLALFLYTTLDFRTFKSFDFENVKNNIHNSKM